MILTNTSKLDPISSRLRLVKNRAETALKSGTSSTSGRITIMYINWR